MSSKPFGNDNTSIKKHSLTRRDFVSAASTAAVALAMPGMASAQGKLAGSKVVFASWGGGYQNAQKEAFCEPFAKETGASVIQDGPVDYGKLRAMLESGKPTWDVVDVTIDGIGTLKNSVVAD